MRQLSMKQISLLILGSSVMVANAEQSDSHYTYGEVVDVKPIVEVVREYHPVKVCREEVIRIPQKRNNGAGQVVGGVVGAIVGSKLGRRGPAKAAGAVAGAAIGASIGKNATTESHGVRDEVATRCSVEQKLEEFERNMGYKVEYQLQGRNYITELPYDPGDKIRLRVSVEPVIDKY